MKIIISILLLVVIAGCGRNYAFNSYSVHTASLRYELLEHNGWTLIPPREGEWRGRNGLAYLPQYFPQEDVAAQYFKSNHNFFYALYHLRDNNDLAVWVKFSGGFMLNKSILLSFLNDPVGEEKYENREKCEQYARQRISVTFNAVDVNFESASFYFVKDAQKIYGTELADTRKGLTEATSYEPSVYNLASEEIIRKRQIYAKPPSHNKPVKFFPYPTFTYKFMMTCTDFEDAILVIDGLYHKGVRLPPLKVRLKYYDFSRVPRYTGPPAVKVAQ